MVRFWGYIVLILILESCVVDQKLSFVQTRNDTHALRLNGIYIYEDNLGIADLLYLYRNGTILSRGSVHIENLEAKLGELESSMDEKYKSMKFLWGRYLIEDNLIKFEKWGASDKVYLTYIREGQIINDSTFVIKKLYSSNGKGLTKLNETYRFRKMETKPDSLNRWVVGNDH